MGGGPLILTSLVAFLDTGRLGPLAPGMALNEVAKILGPPMWWNVVGSENDDAQSPYPYYWCYRDHLEVSFDFEGAPHCNWFQIERASSLRGQVARVTNDIVMSLDGLGGKSPVSAFISAITDIDRVRVKLIDDAGYPSPSIVIDDVEISFYCDDEGFHRDMPVGDLVTLVEAGAGLDSIYSFDRDCYRQVRLAHYITDEKYRFVSGREYLRLCRREAVGDSA